MLMFERILKTNESQKLSSINTRTNFSYNSLYFSTTEMCRYYVNIVVISAYPYSLCFFYNFPHVSME